VIAAMTQGLGVKRKPARPEQGGRNVRANISFESASLYKHLVEDSRGPDPFPEPARKLWQRGTRRSRTRDFNYSGESKKVSQAIGGKNQSGLVSYLR